LPKDDLTLWSCFTLFVVQVGALLVGYKSRFQVGRFPVPMALLDSIPFLQAMTWSTLAIEIALPILVWFRPTRVPTLVVAIAFHLSIDYTMNVFLFQWVMILGWLSFLATTDLRWMYAAGTGKETMRR
jgi:hypothetical protein